MFFKKTYEFKEGAVGAIHALDSNLILFNNGSKNDNPFFYNYSINNNKISKGYINKGKGPNEALGGMTSGLVNNTLWLYDITLKKIITISNINELINDDYLLFREYPIKERFYMISLKDSLNFYGVGSFNTKPKIQEIELTTNKEVDSFGFFESYPKKIPFSAYKSAHESFIFIKSISRDKIVLAYRFTDAIEIFDLKTRESKVIQGPEVYNTQFTSIDAGGNNFIMGVTEETRRSFVNGTVTDKYIYLAYSGSRFNTINSYLSNTVYVYDWNGNPIKKFLLDREILSLTVSKNNKTMYAYDVSTGFIVESNINLE
ncbi:hypothetical protein HHX25_08745 [Flavivirga sp. Y03]|uniref:TolB-like 6-blade propeller-like n=1 Tax=Flavivirga algicola TaxID=2729136 RepID=A0ABX1RX57_9FLAO|nr:hypothetical protein [Flavivirga algicola]